VLAVTVVEASYLFRLAAALYAGEEPAHAAPAHGGWNLGRALLFGAGLVAAAALVLPLGDWLSGVAQQAVDVQHYVAVVLGQGGTVR
jgi:hypothetical protein